MSTLTKSRRRPAKYRVLPGGITEIVYNATPEVVPVLPGTRWLEQRREREARLAAGEQMIEETQLTTEEGAPVAPFVIDTELAGMDLSAGDAAAMEFAVLPDETESEPMSWTDRVRLASTKLIRRQNPWLSPVHSEILIETAKS